MNISIKKKLLLGFLLIIFSSTLITVISIFELKKQSAFTENILKDNSTMSNIFEVIDDEMMNVYVKTLLISINYNDNKLLEKKLKEIKIHHSKINEYFDILFKKYLGPKENVTNTFNTYTKMFQLEKKIIELFKKNDLEKAKKLLNTNWHISLESLHTDLYSLKKFTINNSQKQFKIDAEKEEHLINWISIAMALILIFSLFIAFKIITSVLNALNMLVNITKKINQGDFSIIEKLKNDKLQRSTDEVGKLFRSVYELISHLSIPYANIIKSNRSLTEMTDEVLRLLENFDKYIIASKTDKDGIIIYASQAFLNISGYTKEEMLGKRQNIVRHSDMPSSTFKELWNTIQRGETWTGEIKNKAKDGSYYWINAHISPDIDRNGNIIGYSAIREDITLQKAFQELTNTLDSRVKKEIQDNAAKTTYMLQQSRLAQMGQMISMIAHQWRQPLASISAIAGTLSLDIMMDKYNDKFFAERLESIAELSHHLSITIDDFRGFFKEDKKQEIFEIKDGVDASIMIIGQTLTNKNIKLSVEYIDNPKIKTHLNELKQVILNLLKNAEDILIENKVKEAKVFLKIYVEDSNVCINIEDNGGGVSENIFDKIFDPYFSTKKAKDGTGLGLYMSKTIIEEHCNGELLLKNTQNGALFIIKLPLYANKQYK